MGLHTRTHKATLLEYSWVASSWPHPQYSSNVREAAAYMTSMIAHREESQHHLTAAILVVFCPDADVTHTCLILVRLLHSVHSGMPLFEA